MSEVDLSQLAIDRAPATPRLAVRRNLWSRYVIPGLIIAGFGSLVIWSSWDLLNPPRDVKVVPVIASEAASRMEGTPLFNAAGWIEPRPTKIRVAALAPGVVEKLLVVEDQAVRQGEPVAELIKQDAELAYQRATANRRLAEAELEQARAALVAATTKWEQPVHLEAVFAESEAALAKVQTMLKNLGYETERALSLLDLAERNHQRNLDAAKSVSERERDESLTRWETAKALVRELREREASLLNEQRALKAQTRALQTQLELLTDEIKAKDEAQARVAAAEARLAQQQVAEAEAELRLSRMTIRAPVDGRVYQLVGLPGAQVGNGIMTSLPNHDTSSVITMYQPSSLQARVDVRFEDIPKVTWDQPVRINNPALETPITGTVLFISSEADIQKNTLQVKVSIEQPPEFFKPEMLVDVTFLAPAQDATSTTIRQTIMIPRQLVQADDNGSFLWIADQSERQARRVAVQLGATRGPLVEITAGLRVDHRVISSGIDNLEAGDRIRIIGEDDFE